MIKRIILFETVKLGEIIGQRSRVFANDPGDMG